MVFLAYVALFVALVLGIVGYGGVVPEPGGAGARAILRLPSALRGPDPGARGAVSQHPPAAAAWAGGAALAKETGQGKEKRRR